MGHTHKKKSVRDGEMGKKTEIQERGNHRETEWELHSGGPVYISALPKTLCPIQGR